MKPLTRAFHKPAWSTSLSQQSMSEIAEGTANARHALDSALDAAQAGKARPEVADEALDRLKALRKELEALRTHADLLARRR